MNEGSKPHPKGGTASIAKAKALVRELAAALETVSVGVCYIALHRKSEQHGSKLPCPVEERIRIALDHAREYMK